MGALRAVVEQEPTVVGKPAGFLLEHIMEQHSLSKEQICMVGDRLDTDIEWGNAHGFATALVMTGVTSYEALAALRAGQAPRARKALLVFPVSAPWPRPSSPPRS